MGYSKQRQMILHALAAQPGHLSAEEVLMRLRANNPQISLATVYRNLNVLSESGQVRRIRVPGGADRYELGKTPHDHMVCDRCGKVLDAQWQDLSAAQSALEQQGALVSGYTLIYHGLCPVCAKEVAQDETDSDSRS